MTGADRRAEVPRESIWGRWLLSGRRSRLAVDPGVHRNLPTHCRTQEQIISTAVEFGPEVDLESEEVYTPDGQRLTNERVAELAVDAVAEVRSGRL